MNSPARWPGLRVERLVPLIFLVLMAAFYGYAQPAPLAFDGGAVALDGLWQFHLGDNFSWASPEFDDSEWEKLAADKPWGLQGHPNVSGFAWYRFHVVIRGGPEGLAILVPAIEDAYELYWNGNLVGTYGRMPPRARYYHAAQPRRFSLGSARSGVLAIRVWKAPFGSFDTGLQGGMYAPPIVGSPQAIQAIGGNLDLAALRREQLDIAVNLLYALAGILSFFAWLRGRDQWVLFWAASFTASKPIFALTFSPHDSLPAQISLALAGIFLVVGDISLWFLLLWLLNLRGHQRLLKAVKILACVDLVQCILDGVFILNLSGPRPVPWQIADGLMTIVMTVAEFFPFLILWQAFVDRHRLTRTRWMVAITAFSTQTIFVAYFAFSQGSRFTHWTIGQRIEEPLFYIEGNPVRALLISGVLLLLSIVCALFQYYSENSRRQNELEQEFRNAREVQHVLIPDELPVLPAFRVESQYKPAGEVGGDFFQILPLPSHCALVVIGDVSGKGMPAAMTVSLLVGTLRTLAHYTQSRSSILEAMNTRMLARSRGGFTTCLVMRLSASGEVCAANAGHISPYIDGREFELQNGPPLGLSEQAVYAESTFFLGEQSQITLLTDGVPEARDRSRDLFGFERTARISAASAEQIARAAQQFGQEDDITVLTLRRRCGLGA